MWLIIGLGNPGAKYDGTRHNMGFKSADLLACGNEFKVWKNSLTAKVGGAIIAKPQTFMNLSGRAVRELMAFYKVPLANVIVIHDDMDLKPGDIRTKTGGGAAGHNGLKSIDEAVGKDYFRIRIGVGHPRDSETPLMDVADWVLGRAPEIDISAVPGIIRLNFPEISA
ncbi:MAG: aminoacyl-tRNA hydrolase [Rickettsiales bacterium]|jgi:PTH1 family peptidyl-tRNA hydrolase|nr:aminoacyl-tRNA hydrolase [Rickettsiales bacterium]